MWVFLYLLLLWRPSFVFPRNRIVVSTNSISICSPDSITKINRFNVLGFVMRFFLFFPCFQLLLYCCFSIFSFFFFVLPGMIIELNVCLSVFFSFFNFYFCGYLRFGQNVFIYRNCPGLYCFAYITSSTVS